MNTPRNHPSLVRYTLEVGCLLALAAGGHCAEARAPAPPPPALAPEAGGAAAKIAAPAAAPGSAAPAADLRGYSLYPGDLIAIDVFDQPDLSVVVRIPPNGGIRYPLLGEITPVAGREVNDLGDELKRRLEADYLQQATLTITVREFAKRHAYVMGAIAHPDALTLEPFSHITALGAIGESGGFSEEADRDAVMVMRDGPAGRISFIVCAGSPGHPTRDVELQPNDIVVVPHLDRIYVMGQVAHPGAVNLRSAHNSVLRAIGDAGGFLDEANRDAVVVVREGAAGGSSSTIPIASAGGVLKEIVLQANDTIVVPRLDRVYVIGQVNHPGAVILPSQDPLTVSKAVSLAGGFDRYARESNVQLLHAGVPVQTIDVAAILTGDASKVDPRLAPGDTVFIPQRRY
jgi:protein involved in polysaccharide export with SLBB domain